MQVRGRLCRCEGDYAGARATMQVRGRLRLWEGDYAGARQMDLRRVDVDCIYLLMSSVILIITG